MNSRKRKLLEKQVYNYTYQAGRSRPSFGSFFHRRLNQLMYDAYYNPQLNRLLKTHVKNQHVLVLGASRKDIDLLRPYTKKLSAIDISEKMVNEIKKSYPEVDAFVADAEQLDKLDQKYDVIFCKSILHHLHPFDRIVHQLSQCLKPGGVLLVGSEPGLYNPFAWFGRTFTPSKEHTPGEMPFDYRKYEATLSKYFVPEEVNYHFLVSVGLVVLAAKLPFLEPLFQAALPTLLKLEHKLQHTPLRHLYWLTTGAYKLK